MALEEIRCPRVRLRRWKTVDIEELKEILFEATYKAENKHIAAISKSSYMYTEAGQARLAGEFVSLRSVIEKAGLSEEYMKYAKEHSRDE